jgi:hypothetical protein
VVGTATGVVMLLDVYLVLTMAFLGITAIAAGREIKARQDFRITPFGGTLNVYRYYRQVKNNQEKLSPRFKLFLLAHINLLLCVIVFVIASLAA